MDSINPTNSNNTGEINIKPKTILLIEDEFYIADLYKNILQKAGFDVELAQDGDSGLKMAQSKPDLILLDIMLPKINGLMILSSLKLNPETKSIPIILLTNLGQADIIKQAFTMGASGYLLKMSLKPNDLVKYVNEFIANPDTQMDINSLVLD